MNVTIAQLILHTVLALAALGSGVYLLATGKTEAGGSLLAIAGLVIGRVLPQPTQKHDRAPRDGGHVSVRALGLLFLFALLAASCSNWLTNAHRAAQTLSTAADVTWPPTRAYYQRACGAARATCIAKGAPRDKCPALDACQGERKKAALAIRSVHLGAATVIAAVAQYRAWRDVLAAPKLEAIRKLIEQTLTKLVDASAAMVRLVSEAAAGPEPTASPASQPERSHP